MSLFSLLLLLFNLNIPIRWQIMIILCFSTFIIFMLRINMSVATLQIAKDLSWTETELQNVLSSLYYGYAFGQLPFNFLSHKYGGSIALGISVTISCILNLFIPIASKTSISSVMILQVFVGFFQAGAFPSCYYLYPRWMPISERTVMVAFVVTGVYMGEIVGLGLSGYLVNMKNIYVNNFQIGSWDSCFYVTSLFGVIWFPLFYYFVYDSPSEHPRITDEEYEFIHKGSGFREESEDHEKIVKNVKDNTNEIFIKLDDGESNGDISLIETSLNPIKNVEESQTSSSERNTQQYNSLKQNNDNDNDIENNNFIQDSEKNSIVIDEKSTIVNPLYLSTSTEKEKNEEKSSVVWLHDLKLHPNWHPALPPGRLHHHYHIHHSHKLELHKIPWLKIFTNTASIALLINTFAQGWVTLMILSEMPAFLHQQLGCDISHSSYLSILPYIFNLISVELFSIVFNYLMVKGILTRWQVRQLANRIGLLGPGICVVIVGHVTDPAIGVIILCLALFLFGAVQSGTPCGFMDIAPNFSSEMNTVAIVFLSCAGFLTPMLVSYYQRLYPTSLAWQYVFYITLLICGVAILVWKIFGKSEIIAELNTRI